MVKEYEIDGQYLYLSHPMPVIAVENNISICVPSLNDELCCYTQTFSLEDCHTADKCGIGEIKVEPSQCIAGDETFVWMKFEYEHTGDEGFSVKGNGVDYGSFRYEDLPIKLPVKFDCETFYEFVVIPRSHCHMAFVC